MEGWVEVRVEEKAAAEVKWSEEKTENTLKRRKPSQKMLNTSSLLKLSQSSLSSLPPPFLPFTNQCTRRWISNANKYLYIVRCELSALSCHPQYMQASDPLPFLAPSSEEKHHHQNSKWVHTAIVQWDGGEEGEIWGESKLNLSRRGHWVNLDIF